jgi:hypothetical protein
MLAALCDPAISTAAVAALIEQEPAMVARGAARRELIVLRPAA